MSADPLRGKSIRWSYDDGPMAGKAFEHTFAADGMVTWREIGGKPSAPTVGGEPSAKYEVALVADGLFAVSYLAGSGWTLTTIVDEKTSKIVSFASNEKMLVTQHGKLAS